MDDCTTFGVPEIAHVLLRLSPAGRDGLAVQEVNVPDTVGVILEIPIPEVNV